MKKILNGILFKQDPISNWTKIHLARQTQYQALYHKLFKLCFHLSNYFKISKYGLTNYREYLSMRLENGETYSRVPNKSVGQIGVLP